jgi:hypothetical protein
MKKIITSIAAFSLAVSFASMAGAAAVPTAPGVNKLQCFDGPSEGTIYGGDCTLHSNGAKGPATLDNTDGDTDGSYSGVYVLTSNLNGKTIAEVDQISFNYTGTPTNGSPRLTFPIDTNGDTITDDYISISAYWCNNGDGLVDPIHDATCTIWANSDGVTPVAESWAELVAEHPTWSITDDYAFIVADDVGVWTVGNVKLGKGGK